MRLRSLDGLDAAVLPDEFRFEIANVKDAEQIATLLAKSFPEMTWDTDRARRELFEDPTVVNTWVIRLGELPVATASSRNLPGTEPHVGYIHWVGGDPDHRGKGLGYLVNLAVLDDFKDQGKTEAILDTDHFRIPAIKVYFKLGFRPFVYDQGHRDRWTAISREIGFDTLSV